MHLFPPQFYDYSYLKTIVHTFGDSFESVL